MAIAAKEIVNAVGMSEHPEIYANRAATWTDLNASHLLGIYSRISHEISKNAAEAFVTMVENIKIFSAYNFLNALYALEKRGWTYTPFQEIDLGVGSGDTEYIKSTFLARIHRIPYPKTEYTQHVYHSF